MTNSIKEGIENKEGLKELVKPVPKEKSTYANSLLLLRLFLFLKNYKSGVFLDVVREEFFSDKDLRTFQRFIKAIKEMYKDDHAHHIFHIIEPTGESGKRKIMLNVKYLVADKSTFEEQHVFSVMLADALMANVKKCSEDLSSDLDITDIKTAIVNCLINKTAIKAEENDDDFDDSSFVKEVNAERISKQLKAKFYSKKTGYKVYAEDEEATKVLDQVTNALYSNKKLKIKYKSKKSKENKEHIIRPYTLLEYSGVYYIMGTFDDSKKICLFAVDRIKTARMQKEAFCVPTNYSPAQVIERGIGVGDYEEKPIEVELLFRKEVAYYIKERLWHPTQIIEELDDGKVKLFLKVPLSLELNKLIMSFGSMVKVIAPKELALEIKKDRAVPLYDDIEEPKESEKFLYIMVRPKEFPSTRWEAKWDSKGEKLLNMTIRKEIANECIKAKKENKKVFIHKTSYSTQNEEIDAIITCCAYVDEIKEIDSGKYHISFKKHKILNEEPVYNYRKLKKDSYYFC